MFDPTSKALAINLDRKIFGTFAEIGAGQEVVRHFFRAGGAGQTVAKSMSAYDMFISDAIYGKCDRFVSLGRLQTMLDKELGQLQERLSAKCGDNTTFFVFANTVEAKSSHGHGWIGVRFQAHPREEASQVVLHLNLFDRSSLQQQEALGIVGVNLIYACYHHPAEEKKEFIASLMDNLTSERIEVDMIKVSGPAFAKDDPRLWPLELVKQNLCYSIMFNPQGEVLLAKDALYTKNVLICRGGYRPPTMLHLDMMEQGANAFCQQLEKKEKDNLLLLPSISMNTLLERGEVDHQDFLARVNLLGALEHHSMVFNYENYSKLSLYLNSICKKQIAIVFGYYNLEEIFSEKNYPHHSGGLLGGIGDLVGQRTTLYCYPAFDEKKKKPLSSGHLAKGQGKEYLLSYLKEKQTLQDLKISNLEYCKIWSRTVLKMIQEGNDEWEKMVPPTVRKKVVEESLFGLVK